jgi:hypothetical protein
MKIRGLIRTVMKLSIWNIFVRTRFKKSSSTCGRKSSITGAEKKIFYSGKLSIEKAC